MNKLKNIRNTYRFVLILISTVIAFGCSSENDTEEDNGNNTVDVIYKISTRSSSDIYAEDKEMMKELLLIIVNSNNKIEKLINASLPSTLQEYEIETQLTTGKKIIYGFANLSDAIKSATGLSTLTEGDDMPDLSNATCSILNGYEIDESANKWLPMSNQTSINVININGQSFTLELIRLITKVRFSIQNLTGYSTILKQVSISPLTTSSIYLLQKNDQNGVALLPATITTSNFTHIFSSLPTLQDKEILEYTVYLNESVVSDNNWFKVALETQKTGSSTDIERKSTTNLSHLNRNDYLPLTLILTDYKLDLEILSYPPIGGYPASMTEESEGYHCKFPGGGAFVITPRLIRLSDNTTVDVDNSDWTFTYTDASPSIFVTPPVFKNGEIIGVIAQSPAGKALCNISINVAESEGVSRTLSYKVYISEN